MASTWSGHQQRRCRGLKPQFQRLGVAAVVEISATGKRRVDFDIIDFYHNETQLFGTDSAKLGVAESAPLMAALVDGFESGKLKPPVIAQRFDLQHGQDAYRAVAAGTPGRVVINM